MPEKKYRCTLCPWGTDSYSDALKHLAAKHHKTEPGATRPKKR